MSARAYPLADLHEALARLESEAARAGNFQEHLLPVLAALGEVAKAARVAIEPALAEESHRAIAAVYFRSRIPAGEV